MSVSFISKKHYSFEDLIEIIKVLRSEDGCPWDREQTHGSLKEHMLEECYEVIEAINNNDLGNLKEELGDVLLQVLLHAQIASENNHFSMDKVITELAEKLIRRHPHVFRDSNAETADEVLAQWDQIKKDEKSFTTMAEVLRNVPRALPAVVRAEKVQKKAAKVGFDFPTVEEAFDKVYEEIEELQEAQKCDKKHEIEEEFGDLLFSMVNLSRFFGVNAEFSLTNAVEKFINRFEGVEKIAHSEGKSLESMSLDELDAIWERIK